MPILEFPTCDSPPVAVPEYEAQADFLALFDRLLPEAYLIGLKSPGPGYELYQAIAKACERASLAVGRAETCGFILSAPSAVRATGTVEFYRASASPGAVTQRKGTIVTTSARGLDFVTLADAVFGASDLGPVTVAIEAVAAGWEYNVPGQVTTAAGEVLAGEIDTIRLPLQSPTYGDPTVQVRQIAATSGGQPGVLDQLGADRGIARDPGEGDTAYRARVRQLADTVSPAAIERTLNHVLSPLGISWTFIETWEVTYQTCWDAPAAAIPGSDYDPTCFVYDDPRPPVPFRNRWLGEEDYRGAFIVVLPNIAAVSDVGMAFDDTAMNVAAHATSKGRRAHNAYDVPSSGASALILQGGYDGFDLGKQAVYLGMYLMLQRIKAGGVSATVEIEGT